MRFLVFVAFIILTNCSSNSNKSEWMGDHASDILLPDKDGDLFIVSKERIKVNIEGVLGALPKSIQYFKNDTMVVVDQLGVLRVIVKYKQVYSIKINGKSKNQVEYFGFCYKKENSFYIHDNANLKFVVLNLKTFEISEFPHTFGKDFTFSYLKNDSSMLMGRLGFGRHTNDLPLFWDVKSGSVHEIRTINKSMFDYVQTPFSSTSIPISYLSNNYFYMPLYNSRNILKFNPENIMDFQIFKTDLNIYLSGLLFYSGDPEGDWKNEDIFQIHENNSFIFIKSVEFTSNKKDPETNVYHGTTFLRIYNHDFSRYYRRFRLNIDYFYADINYLYSFDFDQQPNGTIDFYIVKNKYEW